MELKSPISSHSLHAGNDLALSPNQRSHSIPLLLTQTKKVYFGSSSCVSKSEKPVTLAFGGKGVPMA
jgi:hypothetical protein